MILVLEDDPAIRQMIELALGEARYQVVSAPDVDSALARARETRPALVLLDLRLRDDSGERFVSELDRPDCPVVVMTASQDPAAAAHRLGAVGWLAKPFDLHDLFAVVAAHAGPRRSP